MVSEIYHRLVTAKRPIFFFGHGVRLAHAVSRIDPLLDKFQIPALVSWSGADFSDHPLIYGRTGVYGQRCANTILQEADFIVAVGTRLAIPQIGYDIKLLAPGADIYAVDIDPYEAMKYERFKPVVMDAGAFLDELSGYPALSAEYRHAGWRARCNFLRNSLPWLEAPAHDDPPGYISPYRFMARLQQYLKTDQVIVTEMGAALMCPYQILHLKPPQRIITTQGLGEMGFGLPAAIGASFARDKGEVLCLNTDGGMMMNLQEMQTIVHHRLPIKTIVFCNDGYGMIKHTQEAMGHVRSGVDTASGVSTPNFVHIAHAFGMDAEYLLTWKDFDAIIPHLWASQAPLLVQVNIDPEQLYVPKVATIRREDGSLYSPPLNEMSP